MTVAEVVLLKQQTFALLNSTDYIVKNGTLNTTEKKEVRSMSKRLDTFAKFLLGVYGVRGV